MRRVVGVLRGNELRDGRDAPGRSFTLSPSDFAFLWTECPRCFYLQTVGGFRRPRGPFPKIFTVIDRHMKTCFTGSRLELPGMPGGVVGHSDLWVESEPIIIPGRTSRCALRGRLDNVIAFDDGTFGVIDGKTCSTRDEHVPLYGRQLHAYAYCLEHPAPGRPALRPVSRLGLLVFEPEGFMYPVDGAAAVEAALTGAVRWIEVQRDERAFRRFLAEVVALLERPESPPPSPSCEYCRYRHTSPERGV